MNNNIEIVKFLLIQQNIDVNIKSILKTFIFNSISKVIFNDI